MSEWRRAAKTDLRIFHVENSFTAPNTRLTPDPDPTPLPTPLSTPPWAARRTPRPAARLSHSGLLFSYSVPFPQPPGETRGHFRENSEVAGVPLWREMPLQLEKHLCLSPSSSQARLDWWQPTGELCEKEHTNRRRWTAVPLAGVRQQNSSIQNFLDYYEKKDNCNMKRKLKKSLWNVWIFDSHPINKRTVFSLLSFLFGEKKMTMNLGNWNFYVYFCFSLFFSVNEQMWFGFWTWNLSFSSLSLFLLHLPFVIPSLFFFWFVFVPHPFSLFVARSLTQDPVEKAASILHVFFCNLFCIYFCLHSWRQDSSRLVWQAPSICPPANFVWFLSFSIWSFSQYLPVLSKCYCKVFQWDDSKYVYINRGNTLGYILLNPRVALSLSGLLVFLSTEVLSNEATECLLIILEVFYESNWK